MKTCARLGLDGYARLLAALVERPMTKLQFMAETSVGRTAARRFLQAMHRAGRIHITDWTMAPRTLPQEVWLAGTGVDAQPPTSRPNGAPAAGKPACKPRPSKPELVSFLALLEALDAGPSTAKQLHSDTGLSIQTVRKVVHTMRRYDLAHIGGWETHRAPVYVCGPGSDKKRTRGQSKHVINRSYRERQAILQTARFLRMFALDQAPAHA